MDVRSEKLVALVDAEVSAIDGIPYTTQNGQTSAFLGTFFEMLQKMNNRILTASTTLISGGSAGAVAVGTSGMGSATASAAISGIYGTLQGVPFYIQGEPLSGSPASNASPGYSTTSMTIRKVLVCLTGSALPVASSMRSDGGWSLQFVYGSAYAVSVANAVSTGGVSAWFNQVPLPKPSAHQVPLGWLNIPCSHAASAGLANTMLITDLRETQGFDLSALQGTVWQP